MAGSAALPNTCVSLSTPLEPPLDWSSVVAPTEARAFVTFVNPSMHKGLLLFARIVQCALVDAPLARWDEEDNIRPEGIELTLRIDDLRNVVVVVALPYLSLPPASSRGSADHLRVTGEYLPLLNRAKEKQKKLLQLGLEEPDLAYAGLERERLFAWYFQERISVDKPENIRGYAEELGCSEDDLLRMVLREYLFLNR